MKNIILLKNLPSNLVEEAIVVLKENARVQKYQIKELEENNKQINDGNNKNDKELFDGKSYKNKDNTRKRNDTKYIHQKDNIYSNDNDSKKESYQYENSRKGKSEKNFSKEDNKEYIIKEAEMLIKNYIDNLEKKSPKWKNNMKKLEKRYKNSVKLNFILAFTILVEFLFIVL